MVVDSITKHPEWLQRQLEIYERAALADAGADPAVSDLAEEGRRWKLWHHAVRRVLAVAHRKTTQAGYMDHLPEDMTDI